MDIAERPLPKFLTIHYVLVGDQIYRGCFAQFLLAKHHLIGKSRAVPQLSFLFVHTFRRSSTAGRGAGPGIVEGVVAVRLV